MRMRPFHRAAAAVFALAVAGACSESSRTAPTGPEKLISASPAAVSVYEITPKVDSLIVGQSVVLHQRLTDGKTIWIGQNVRWSVSDTTIARIVTSGCGNQQTGCVGTLTGKKAGTVTVTATTQFNTSKSISVRVVNQTTGTAIYPGTNIQSVVNAYPGGTTFILKHGSHRMQSVVPKTGDKFIGEAGALMTGSRLLMSFTRSGSYWVASGQTQQGPTSGRCYEGWEGCIYPEDLWINSVLLQHVTSLSLVGPGKWYFDYAADKIYLADDPTGKTVETSVLPYAFSGSGVNNITIQGIIIEKYATPANQGAVNGQGTSGWLVQNNELRSNHGAGVRLGNSMQVLNNKINSNGLEGVNSANISHSLVEGNEIAYNNTAHYHPYWQGGATKFGSSSYITVRGNNVHHNFGKGIWADINCIYLTIENNTVTDNDHQGIQQEIGYDAIIRNNDVERNGFGNPGVLAGSGINVVSSPNVEIYGNRVVANMNGIVGRQYAKGSGTYGPHEINNLYVHDNTIVMTSGQTGLLEWVNDTTYYTKRNNRFVHNTYYLNGLALPFWWADTTRTAAEWKKYGQDVTGTFNP